MKLLTFIRRRSFARYIMVDVSEAARRLGWDVHWIDLEGRLHATCNESTDGKYQVVADMLLGIGRFNPDLVFSYGLEYLEPVFETYIDGFGTRFHEILRRPAVYYLCDFGYPFDGTSDQHVPAHYLAPLQSQHSLVLCWTETRRPRCGGPESLVPSTGRWPSATGCSRRRPRMTSGHRQFPYSL